MNYMTNKTWVPKTDDDINNYRSLLFLGLIPNQSGHGVYINLKFNTTHVIDINELVELTEDEL